MKQMFRIALHNIGNGKWKTILIVCLMAGIMIIGMFSISAQESFSENVTKASEELDATAKIKVIAKEGEGIPTALIEQFKQIKGVKSVIAIHNIAGFFETKEQEILGYASVIGFDFDESILEGASDYRGQEVSGIIVPDLEAPYIENAYLNDFVGEVIEFEYEYEADGVVYTKEIEMPVIGTYTSNEESAASVWYLSMDLYNLILKDCGQSQLLAKSAVVYADDVESVKSVAIELEKYGMNAFFDMTAGDYKESLKESMKMIYGAMAIIMFLIFLVVMQTALANLQKRKTTIAVLKAYGTSNGKICFMIWAELFMYVILAFGVALLVGLTGISTVGADIGVVLSEKAIFIMLCIGMFIAGVASVAPCVKMIRLDPIDILKSN